MVADVDALSQTRGGHHFMAMKQSGISAPLSTTSVIERAKRARQQSEELRTIVERSRKSYERLCEKFARSSGKIQILQNSQVPRLRLD